MWKHRYLGTFVVAPVRHPSGHDIQLMGLFNGNGGHALMSVQAFSSAD
jgi:hypothetical protein